jgi:guanylate kinase
VNKLMLTDSGASAGGESAESPELLPPDALVIVLIGASAVGKSAIAEYLCETGTVEATPTWTTREPRPGELDTSYDHRFVSNEEFDRQSELNGFIDQQAFYGARYGVPALQQPTAGKEALMVLKPVFMPVFIERYSKARIYQIEASPIVLPGRMRERGQSEKDIAIRMQHHTAEASAARRFAHVIFNNNGPLERTLAEVESQIRADRAAYNAERLKQA